MLPLPQRFISIFSFLLIVPFSLIHAQGHKELTGGIQGLITATDGNPAADVSIHLIGTTKSTKTDDDGSFHFRNIQPGNYELEISCSGCENLREPVQVESNKTSQVTARLKTSGKQLQEVVITGNNNRFATEQSEYVAKLPLKDLENAQVYTTISKDLLRQQLVFSVDDATRNAPGIQKMWDATGRGGDGGAYYNARGFILQGQLRNGVAGNVTSRIDAANLESIEIIKGPSATLFGSTLTSYGGLINRVTKKPYDRFGGEITYATGSYNFNRIALDLNAPLNASKSLLMRVNAAYNYEGSFQDNGFDKGYVIAPSLSYRVNERLSFLFDAELYHGVNTSKQIIFFYYPASQLGATNPEELGIDYRRSYSANDIFQVSKNHNFFGQMNYKISDQWRSQTNYTSTHSFSDGPYAYFYVMPNAVATGDPNATGADYLVRADQSTANSTAQVTEIQQNFIGDFKTGSLRHRMIVGLDYFNQNSNQLFYGTDFDTVAKNGNIAGYENLNRDNLNETLQTGTPWTYPYRYKTNTYSAYLADVLNITHNVIVSAAIRADHFVNKGNYDMASATYSGSYEQTAFSPKLGLVYQPVKDKISLFANYQDGFTNQTGTDYNGKTFKPEHATQKEAGVKLDAFKGRIHTTISYYSIQVEDIVRPYAADPNFSIQDGTQTSRGIEAEVIANPWRGLNMLAGFAYNDSKIEKADADVEGRRPATAMSPYTANLWISYRMSHGKARGFGIGFGGNYASDNKILNSEYYGVFTLPEYTVWNATVFYEKASFRAAVKIDNLTNQEYWIGYTTMSPQKLRSITGSISFRF